MDLIKFSDYVVPTMIVRCLCESKFDFLFYSEESMQKFSAYCVYKYASNIYQLSLPQKSLRSHLLDYCISVGKDLNEDEYELYKRTLRNYIVPMHEKTMKEFGKESPLSINFSDGNKRHQGYLLTKLQFEQIRFQVNWPSLRGGKGLQKMGYSEMDSPTFVNKFNEYDVEIKRLIGGSTPEERIINTINLYILEDREAIESIYILSTAAAQMKKFSWDNSLASVLYQSFGICPTKIHHHDILTRNRHVPLFFNSTESLNKKETINRLNDLGVLAVRLQSDINQALSDLYVHGNNFAQCFISNNNTKDNFIMEFDRFLANRYDVFGIFNLDKEWTDSKVRYARKYMKKLYLEP